MRRALVDVDAELLPELARTLMDSGLKIVGSCAPESWLEIVRLIIEGNCLPEECEKGWKVVRPTFVQEQYGSQKLIRLHEITVLGAPQTIPSPIATPHFVLSA